jgi:glucose/arabinose dehydrogenase
MAVLFAVGLLQPLAPRPASALPLGFTDTRLTSIGLPVSTAFTPDRRMLITTQPGFLRIYQGGSLLPIPALDLSKKVCTNRERGLIGVVADPMFATNQFIYLYYTFNKYSNGCPTAPPNTPVNRLSRFVLPNNNVIDPASEVVLLDNISSIGGFHNSGDLHFGTDGYLYVSVGDSTCQVDPPNQCNSALNDNSRKLTNLNGKILRIAKDGTVPLSNPFAAVVGSKRCGNPAGPPTGAPICKEIFSYGLRNPFRFTFKPGTNDFYINDVGHDSWEEIDVGAAAADYGWNIREGHCARDSTTNCGKPPVGMTNPIFDYPHAFGCSSITGGAFVPAGLWPAPYDGSYLFADFSCARIFRLVSQPTGTYPNSLFTEDVGHIVSMQFGPWGSSQALYYTTYLNGGEIRRIAYTGGNNRLPTAVLSADPTNGAAPLNVSFDGTGSNDPDPGDVLTYLWDFGDGATTETPGAAISHSYAAGTYFASLTVRDQVGAASDPITVRIDSGNFAPSVTMDAPVEGHLFRVDEQMVLQAHATDPEDGTLEPSSLTWVALLHHHDHQHPYLNPTNGNNITLEGPAPEGFTATANSYLDIFLTATDSKGLSTTTYRQLLPHLVTIGFRTSPQSGLKLDVNGVRYTTPVQFTSWEGYAMPVNAPDQREGVYTWKFQYWSDGGAQAHTITTPATTITYQATFKKKIAVPG